MTWEEILTALKNLYYGEGFEHVRLDVDEGHVEVSGETWIKDE